MVPARLTTACSILFLTGVTFLLCGRMWGILGFGIFARCFRLLGRFVVFEQEVGQAFPSELSD